MAETNADFRDGRSRAERLLQRYRATKTDPARHPRRRAGATGWMVKAFDPVELLEVVKQVLR